MQLLYSDQLAPMTGEVGFLQCSAEAAGKEFHQWAVEHNRSLNRQHIWGSLASVLRELLPLTDSEIARTLFVPTKSDWTAYFDNSTDGPDVSSRLSPLRARIGCRGVRMACIPHTMRKEAGQWKGRWGATILEVYPATKGDSLACERSIAAVNDGGPWVFDNYGEPYDFEHVENYQRRRVRDRFTPEMLDEYLQHLGIHAFDEDFYVATKDNPAILLEKDAPLWRGTREYTLEEARADF